MRLTVSDKELSGFPMATELLNSGAWGKGRTVLALLEMGLERYGFVPEDREGIKALESWANGNISAGSPPKQRAEKTRRKIQKVRKTKTEYGKQPEPFLGKNELDEVQVAKEEPKKDPAREAHEEAVSEQVQTSDYHNDGEDVDPFAALGFDMGGIM